MRFIVLCLFSLSLLAHSEFPEPITEFPEGNFLGGGKFTSDDGVGGLYASYAEIGADYWDIYHYRDGEAFHYSAEFTFKDHGFFDVTVTDYSFGENRFNGRGFCGSVQCHFSVLIDGRILEETATFLPEEGRIYWLGSITSHNPDADDSSFAMSWEESMISLDSDASDDHDGDDDHEETIRN